MNGNENRGAEERFVNEPRLPDLLSGHMWMRAEVEHALELSRKVNAALAQLSALFGRLRVALEPQGVRHLRHN